VALPSIAPGTLFGSRWIVGRVLGKGELAIVYEAEESRAARFSALKLLDSALGRNAEAWTRFETLTRSIAQIPGEGIARSYEVGLVDGRPFVVTERSVFPTLSRYVSERGALSVRSFRDTLATLAGALDAVHAAGITHGNLKPQNVFVSVDNPGWARLSDFGLAELREANRVPNPRTLGWNAPEVSPGAPTPASDLYALGLICFFALSGSPWFSAQRATTASGVPRPRLASERARSFGGEISPLLDAWFNRALADDPKDRFGNAIDMANAFARALEAPPESAHPLSETIPVPERSPLPRPTPSAARRPDPMGPTDPQFQPTVPVAAREQPAFPSNPPLMHASNPPAPFHSPSGAPPHSPSRAPQSPSVTVPPLGVILIVVGALVIGALAFGALVFLLLR
jgi:serine/threonine protein kinase